MTDEQAPIEIVGDVARCAICAPPGHRLLIGDFSGIESRVLAWIADEPAKLEQWRRFDRTQDAGDDPYVVIGRSLGHSEQDARKFGKIADLAFGFQGGVDAYKNFAPKDDVATEAQIEAYKRAWREAHPQIEQFWRGINRAAVAAVTRLGAPITYGRLTLQCERLNGVPFLFITLPSGRRLSYPFAKLIQRVYNGRGYPAVEFMDNAIVHGGWTPCNFGNGAYGGLWTENVVQAIARDLLAAAMLRLEAAGYPIVAHVHDEILSELPNGEGSLDEFKHLIERVPEWAVGLPVAAKVRNGPRFAEVDVPVVHVPGSQEAPPPRQKAKRAPALSKPAAALPLDPEMVARVMAFAVEREAIRLRKEAGQAAPWTTDPILATGYFCNVDRSHDRVTHWIAENWRDPHRDDPHLWSAMTTARCINEPDALAEIGYPVPFDAERVRNVLAARQLRGDKVFRTDAYKPPTPPEKSRSTISFLVEDVLGPLWRDREQLRPQPTETLRAYSDRLRERYRIGPFLAGQVIADLKHVEPLRSASDWWTFAVPGPGSLRGLNRVCKREVKASWSEAVWHATLLQLGTEIAPQLEASGIARLDAQNLQNVLCEADKYFRAQEKGGNPSRKYKPAAAPKSTRTKKSPTPAKPEAKPQGSSLTRQLDQRVTAIEAVLPRVTGSHAAPAVELPSEQQRAQPESPKFSNVSDEGPVNEPKAAPEPDAIPAHIIDDTPTAPKQPPPASSPPGGNAGGNGAWRASGSKSEAEGDTYAKDHAGEPFSDAHLLRRGYQLTRVFDYTLADGTLRYQQNRYDLKPNIPPLKDRPRKRFLPHRKVNGQDVVGAGDRHVLYNWPAIMRAGPGAIVFAPEGEGKVDALTKAGWLATTVLSHDWAPECIAALTGYHVIIPADHDKEGEILANDARAKLAPVAASVRVVPYPHLWAHLSLEQRGGDPEPAPGEDIKDWLDKRKGDATKLLDICREVPADGIISAKPYQFPAEADIPQWLWLYGWHLLRSEVAGTAAMGGTGKSTLSIVEALAMASGRALLGPFVPTPLRVVLINLEDTRNTMDKRIAAVMRQYGLTAAEIGDRLIVIAKGEVKVKIAKQRRSGDVERNEQDIVALIRLMREHRVDVLSIDSFIRTHRVNENDNSAIQEVVECFEDVATAAQCAVHLWHHTRKSGGDKVTIESARGAIAFIDACRSARILETMSAKEHEQLAGIEPGMVAPGYYFRAFNGKRNFAPPAEQSDWFKIESFTLANGDNVGVVTVWRYPASQAAATPEAIERILAEIDRGMPNGQRYSNDNAATTRAAWPVVRKHCPDKTEDQCRHMVAAWIKNGVLYQKKYRDPVYERQQSGLFARKATTEEATTSA